MMLTCCHVAVSDAESIHEASSIRQVSRLVAFTHTLNINVPGHCSLSLIVVGFVVVLFFFLGGGLFWPGAIQEGMGKTGSLP